MYTSFTRKKSSPLPTIAIPTIEFSPKELLPFAQFCVAYPELCDRSHHFTRAFKDHANKEKRLRRWSTNTLEANPLDPSSPMKWLSKSTCLMSLENKQSIIFLMN